MGITVLGVYVICNTIILLLFETDGRISWNKHLRNKNNTAQTVKTVYL